MSLVIPQESFLKTSAKLFRGIYKANQLCFIEKDVELGKGVIIRPFAFIEESCTIGDKSFIGYGVMMRKNSHVGSYSSVGHLTVLEGVYLGDRVSVHAQVHLGRGTAVLHGSFIAPFCVTTNTKRMSHGRGSTELSPVLIREGVRVGASCTFMPGVIVGQNAIIGSRSLVTKDVPDGVLAYGSPAKVVGEVPESEFLYR